MQNKKSAPPITHTEFLKEVSKLATKAELYKEINKLDDKIDKVVNRLAGEIVKTQTDLKEVKETMITNLSNTESRILNAIDAFAQKAENYDRKALIHEHRIEEHEVCITQLEKSVSKS